MRAFVQRIPWPARVALATLLMPVMLAVALVVCPLLVIVFAATAMFSVFDGGDAFESYTHWLDRMVDGA